MAYLYTFRRNYFFFVWNSNLNTKKEFDKLFNYQFVSLTCRTTLVKDTFIIKNLIIILKFHIGGEVNG